MPNGTIRDGVANTYANFCEREITLRDQRRFANCFQQFADSPSAKKCIDPYNGVDKLAPDAGERMCATIDKILQYSAREVIV